MPANIYCAYVDTSSNPHLTVLQVVTVGVLVSLLRQAASFPAVAAAACGALSELYGQLVLVPGDAGGGREAANLLSRFLPEAIKAMNHFAVSSLFSLCSPVSATWHLYQFSSPFNPVLDKTVIVSCIPSERRGRRGQAVALAGSFNAAESH